MVRITTWFQSVCLPVFNSPAELVLNKILTLDIGWFFTGKFLNKCFYQIAESFIFLVYHFLICYTKYGHIKLLKLSISNLLLVELRGCYV